MGPSNAANATEHYAAAGALVQTIYVTKLIYDYIMTWIEESDVVNFLWGCFPVIDIKECKECQQVHCDVVAFFLKQLYILRK